MQLLELGPCLVARHLGLFEVVCPPGLEALQGEDPIATELCQDLHGGDGADVVDALGVVAARQHGEQDHLLSRQPKVLGDFGDGERFTILFLFEKVLVDGFATKHPNIGVVGDRSVAVK